MNNRRFSFIIDHLTIISLVIVIFLLSACSLTQTPVPDISRLEGRLEAVHRLNGVPRVNIDVNHDYRITEDEFVAYAKRSYNLALKKFDQNGDGLVSMVEYVTFKKDRTAILLKPAMDKNDDKQISEVEFDSYHKAKLTRTLGATSGDAMLSFAHITAQAKKRFAQLDANHDDMLDAGELPSTIEKPYYDDKGNYPKNKTRTSDGWSHSGGWYYTGCEGGPAPPKPCWPVFYPTPSCSPWFGCYQGDGPDPSGSDEPTDPCIEDPFGCDCVFSSSWPCREW